jgi:hypothetical protein
VANPQAAPIKGSVSVTVEKPFDDIIDLNGGQGWWNGLSPQTKNEIGEQYQKEYIQPAFQKAKASPQAYEETVNQFKTDWGIIPTPPTPQVVNPQQGLQNLGDAFGQGVANFGQAALNPQTYTGLAQQAGNAIQTELQNRIAPPKDFGDAVFKGFNNTPLALMPGAVSGVRDLAQGALSLPADIGNAYQGQQAFKPAVQLPELFKDIRSQYPVSSFVGEQAPFAIPFGEAAQAGKAGGLLKSIGEGAAIGALSNPQGGGLKGRISNAAMGATLPAALGVAARGFKPTPKTEVKPLPQAKVKGFEYAQAVGKRQGGQFTTRDVQFEQANKKLVAGIKQTQSVNEQASLQAQLRKLKKQVEILDSVGRDENAPHYTRQTAKKLKEQTTAEYTKAQGEYNSKYQPVKQQKKVLNKQQSEQAVKAGIRARGKGGRVAAQYENYLSTVHPDSKRIVNAEIKARQGKVKAQASVEKERAEIRREKGKAKAQEINKTRDEQRRENC